MKAVSMLEPKSIAYVDAREPVVGAEDVLVEVRLVGLCGSDLAAYQGLSPMVTYPRIPGHEVSGVVVAKGDRVPARVAIGDKVMVSPYSNCGLCPACRIGRFNCCEHNETLGVQRDGVLTSRFAIHYGKAFASKSLSFEELALAEPLSVGYHATNRGRVSETDTVLVLGCGTIGMGAIVAAARKGARVIALDVDERKLTQARSFGAAETIDSRTGNAPELIRDLTDGEGVNVAIEAIGLPQTYRLAVESTCYAGRVVYIGYAKHEVSYDSRDFVRKELDILGSRNALNVFPSVIKMIEARERPFADLVSRVYPFAQAAEAFRDWASNPPSFTKIVIDVTA